MSGKISFNLYEKSILKRRKGLDVTTCEGYSTLLSVEKEFREAYFRIARKISLKLLVAKIKKEYPTLQEKRKD